MNKRRRIHAGNTSEELKKFKKKFGQDSIILPRFGTEYFTKITNLNKEMLKWKQSKYTLNALYKGKF
jgi:hypothetical protein